MHQTLNPTKPKAKKMWKKMALMLVGFALFLGAVAGYKYYQIQSMIAMYASMTPPPESVTTAIANESVIPQTIEETGSFASVQGVMVSAEEPGKVVQIGFESGQKVQKGDLLVQIDISVEQAQLESSKAKSELALANLSRLKNLSGTGAISQKEMDDADSQVKQTQAEIDQLKATIARKTIRAPFAGVTGIRQIQVGQYLSAGNPIVPLQTLNPIYLNFAVPQQDVARLVVGQTVKVSVDAFPNDSFEGKVTAINPQVNETTRTIQVQATMQNPTEKVRPGMFAKAAVILSESQKYVLVPATAVNRAPYGDSIYIAEKMKDPQTGKEYLGARQVFVKLGPMRGDLIAVLDGVPGGSEVVTSGLFKLHPNAAIQVNNEVVPDANTHPKPADN